MESVKIFEDEKLEYSVNEAYKTLRTNLGFCGADTKVIMLTSCTPNEGKSTIAIHLGKTLAEDNKKVLLIDADIRKSVLVGRYSVGKVRGLSHYLSGQEEMDKIIYHTDAEGMDIIFAGPVTPNPTELLGSDLFKELIEENKDNYDYILIDSAPLGLVIDSAVISHVCDGCLMVIENNHINYRYAQDVKKQLQRAGCRILGVVLNKVKTGKTGYGKYGKYGQYGRYSKNGIYGSYGE